MKKIAMVAIVSAFTISNFESCGDQTDIFSTHVVKNPPQSGCKSNIKATFRNNCDERLSLFFLQVKPGTTVPCSSLNFIGSVDANQSISVTINSGYTGRYVFEENSGDKCDGSNTKSDGWLDCSQTNGSDAYFDICK
jgi:hypothetical protein